MIKIDVKQSVILKFNSKYDLSNGVLDLGKQGYFSDYEDFRQYTLDTLFEVKCKEKGYIYPFVRKCKEDESEYEIVCYKYFIPEDKVVFLKKNQKKLRPFKTVDEFISNKVFLGIGGSVHYRYKPSNIETTTAYMGYSTENGELFRVLFGPYTYSPEELLTSYEYEYEGKWVPFGIEE